MNSHRLSALALSLGVALGTWTACTPVDHAGADVAGGSASPSNFRAEAVAEISATSPVVVESLATFGGGCFWCMESPFEKLAGVSAVISGYTGGDVENPTYEEVCSGRTGHTEAVQVHYDPSRVTFDDLLEVYWRQVVPTDPDGQFVDRGSQYRTGIFYHDEAQRITAEASKQKLAASGRFDAPLVTPVEPAGIFYAAEEYHQDYYTKSSAHYKRYRNASGRDRYLDAVWGDDRTFVPSGAERVAAPWVKPTEDELRKLLTPLQYEVTQEEGTERPFQNPYWNEKRNGIYVDIVSGEPLFSSVDKFKSGTGWPSFVRPLSDDIVLSRDDFGLFGLRSEVRSTLADSHLGHVFDDGPEPTGLRYCMNSAALRFVPLEDLDAEGLAQYVETFEP